MKIASAASQMTGRRLLQAATALLEEDGLAAVTMRAVGDKAGVSRQTPYRHFADKDAMLAAVAAEGFVELDHLFAQCQEQARSPIEQLEKMIHVFIQFAFAHPALYQLMFGPDIRTYAEVQAAGQVVFSRLLEVMSQGFSSGFRRADEVLQASALVFAAAHGAVHLALAGHSEWEKGLQAPEQLLVFLLRLLPQG